MELEYDYLKGISKIEQSSSYEMLGEYIVVSYKGCNLKCPYCPKEVRESSYSDSTVSLRAFKKKVDEAFEDGIKNIVLGGGEPTFHKEIIPLTYWLEHRGFEKIKINTNGLRPELLNQCRGTDLEFTIRSSPSGYRSRLKAPGSVTTRIDNTLNLCRLMDDNAVVVLNCVPDIFSINDVNSILASLRGVKRVIIQQGVYKDKKYNFDDIVYIQNFVKRVIPNTQIRWHREQE